MSRIVYFTRFLPTLRRGGGSRRTMQMVETLVDLNVQVVSAPRGDGVEAAAFSRIEEESRNLNTATGNPSPGLALWSTQRRRGVFRLKEIARAWKENTLLFKELSLALVDDPLYFPSLVQALEKKGIPMVAVCHNIESLSAGQVAEDSAMRLLEQEIGILKSSTLVITISIFPSRSRSAVSILLGLTFTGKIVVLKKHFVMVADSASQVEVGMLKFVLVTSGLYYLKYLVMRRFEFKQKMVMSSCSFAQQTGQNPKVVVHSLRDQRKTTCSL